MGYSMSTPAPAEYQHKTRPVTLSRRYPEAPMVGTAVVVINAQGQVLLVQRARAPRIGSWGLPGGLLDLGERLVDGARREVMEECGVDVEIVELVAAFEPVYWDEDGRIEYHYVVLDYWGHYRSGEARPDDDAAAVAWVSAAELPLYDLLPDSAAVIAAALEKWQASTS